MATRAEITAKYAREYKQLSKKDQGRLLDEVVSVTGWSRDNARRRLSQAAAPKPKIRGGPSRQRKPRPFKYSYDARKTLQRVWAMGLGQCGKYLVVSLPGLLDALEAHGELVAGVDRYSSEVKEELLSMSAATIDRYLKPLKEGLGAAARVGDNCVRQRVRPAGT